MNINFTISEGEPQNSINYNNFKKDFLNPKMTVKDLQQKYNINYNNYRKLRERICDEEEITQKPTVSNNKKGILDDKTYVHKYGDGFAVIKYINNQRHYYGTYKNLETSKKIRDKLMECNWDKTQLQSIKEEVKFEENLKCL